MVTLSVNMMCTHLYYCSMRCLYYNMLYKLQAYACGCVCLRTCVCLCGCEWVDVFVECTCSMNVDLCIHLYRVGLLLHVHVFKMCNRNIPYKSSGLTLHMCACVCMSLRVYMDGV